MLSYSHLWILTCWAHTTCWTYSLVLRWLAYPNGGRSSSRFVQLMWMFARIIKEKSLVLIEWSRRSHVPPPLPLLILTIESRMLIIIWARNLNTFEHISFWYLFLEPHQTRVRETFGLNQLKSTPSQLLPVFDRIWSVANLLPLIWTNQYP